VGVSRSGSTEVNASLWDAIVGIKGVVYLGGERTWFIPYYRDVGTGLSDLTWLTNLDIGYQYNWGALVAPWHGVVYKKKHAIPFKALTSAGCLLVRHSTGKSLYHTGHFWKWLPCPFSVQSVAAGVCGGLKHPAFVFLTYKTS
jgi:hypothetical protein